MKGTNLCSITLEGFAWPEDVKLYHATVGLRSILWEGFKVRSDVGMSATGGGTAHAVSLAYDPRVAESILVGLEVLRQGASGELSLSRLLDLAERETPKGLKAALSYLERNEAWTSDTAGYVDRGYRHATSWPKVSVNPEEDWIVTRWVQPGRAASWWEPDEEGDYRATAFAQLYKALLAFGEMEQECYNPVFFGTDMQAMKQVDPRDLGILEVVVHVERVCMEPLPAYQFGYLSLEEAKGWRSSPLKSAGYDCAHGLESRSRGRDPYVPKGWYGVPRDGRIGPLTYKGDRPRDIYNPSRVMVAASSMSELRVFAPDRIEITDHWTLSDVENLRGVRAFHPFFREFENLSGELPGQRITRTCRST